MRFLDGLRPALYQRVDVLIFNPPYVPTPDEEVLKAIREGGIEASWAGGTDGRMVIDQFLPQVEEFLARGGGRCYLVLVDENKPKAIASYFVAQGMDVEVRFLFFMSEIEWLLNVILVNLYCFIQ